MDVANNPNNQGQLSAAEPVQPNNPNNQEQKVPADRPRAWRPRIVSLFLTLCICSKTFYGLFSYILFLISF